MQSPFLTKDDSSSTRKACIGVVCKNICDETGTTFDGNVFSNCICVDEFNKRVQLIGAGIPRRYWKFSFDDLLSKFKERNTRSLNLLIEYCNCIKIMVEGGSGLYIQGREGLAKSALAFFILRNALAEGLICYSIRMSQITKLIFESLSSSEKKEQLDWIRNEVQLLFIDEIEKDYKISDPTSFSGTHVSEFFGDIYDRQIAIIVTSNVPRKELTKVQSISVVDRLSELVEVTLLGDSFRSQNAALEKIVKS